MSTEQKVTSNPLLNRLLWATNLKPNEVSAALTSFLFVFTLMVAYYLLRPIRDALASDWSDAEVSILWTINFFVSTILVAVYGWVISKVKFQSLVPSVYGFFAASFALFYILTNGNESTLIDKSFYLWVSVFALFHVSVFWSCMADTFNQEQSTRVFSVIATGASVGAIGGPLLAKLLIDTIGIDAMILVSAGLLLLPILLLPKLRHLKQTELQNAELEVEINDAKIGGNPFHGFKDFFTNPYLIGIGVFIILYTGIGSFIYLQLKNLLADFSLEQRASIYSYRDAITNTITFVMALFLTGRIVPKLGMPVALSIVPVILIFGMLVLAMSPFLLVALGLWITRSAGNYGLARPAREMLFTKVSRESRFKTKPVVDIVAYRGGDVIMAWFFTGLTQGLGLGMAAVALVGAGIATLWAGMGWYLGKIFDRKEDHKPPEP
jgi:AAA family ATP:ADP antiporter